MQLRLKRGDRQWRVASEAAVDISIPLEFDGAQPAFFGARRAQSSPLELGGFVGQVASGGSCNCSVLTVTPHCNGTHTECVGHIVEDASSVTALVPATLLLCRLVTIAPRPLADSGDDVAAPAQSHDLVIDTGALSPWLDSGECDGLTALVIRTQPNGLDKRVRDWNAVVAPYFTAAALRAVAATAIEHLVVDLPSLDRTDDAGRLAAHRAWWGLPHGSRRLADATRPQCTVTELAYIPDSAPDGLYLLSLQVAPFVADATPSRPVLLPLRAER